MIIVIDAYNVLKWLHGPDVSPAQCDAYIAKLKRYAKKKKHAIILVFDGGYSDWPSKEKHGNLIVIYSGYKETADEVIKRYLEDNRHKDILLVTADRELINHAAQLKLVAIEPMIFTNYVSLALEKLPSDATWAAQEAQKLHESDSEIDSLMQEASMKIIHKKDEENLMFKKNKPKAFKVSKKDRVLIAKLKKL